MSAWERDLETAALEYLTRAVGDEKGARQILDGLREKARAERDAEIIAWLGKKAGELRGLPKRRQESVPDAILTMADKIRRGAVRLGGAS